MHVIFRGALNRKYNAFYSEVCEFNPRTPTEALDSRADRTAERCGTMTLQYTSLRHSDRGCCFVHQSHTDYSRPSYVCYSGADDTSFVPVSANLMLRLTSATINKTGTESTGVLHRCLFLNHDVSIKSSANQRGSMETNLWNMSFLPHGKHCMSITNTKG